MSLVDRQSMGCREMKSGHYFRPHPPTSKMLPPSLDKMLHDNYLCPVESNQQQTEEVRSKIQAENLETKATPKRVCIRLKHMAPTPLSRDTRVKMEKSSLHIFSCHHQQSIKKAVQN